MARLQADAGAGAGRDRRIGVTPQLRIVEEGQVRLDDLAPLRRRPSAARAARAACTPASASASAARSAAGRLRLDPDHDLRLDQPDRRADRQARRGRHAAQHRAAATRAAALASSPRPAGQPRPLRRPPSHAPAPRAPPRRPRRWRRPRARRRPGPPAPSPRPGFARWRAGRRSPARSRRRTGRLRGPPAPPAGRADRAPAPPAPCGAAPRLRSRRLPRPAATSGRTVMIGSPRATSRPVTAPSTAKAWPLITTTGETRLAALRASSSRSNRSSRSPRRTSFPISITASKPDPPQRTVSRPTCSRISAPLAARMVTACRQACRPITTPSQGACSSPSVGSMARPSPSIFSANTGSGVSASGAAQPASGAMRVSASLTATAPPSRSPTSDRACVR